MPLHADLQIIASSRSFNQDPKDLSSPSECIYACPRNISTSRCSSPFQLAVFLSVQALRQHWRTSTMTPSACSAPIRYVASLAKGSIISAAPLRHSTRQR